MTEPVVFRPVEQQVATSSAPQPAIFNFNAYSPAEIEEAIEKVGVTKAALPLLPCLMLAVIAGGAIALGNFIGGAGLAVLVLASHHLDMNDGHIAVTMLTTATAKISPSFVTLFVKGILCNILVCMAVWLTAAGHSIADKIIALILPVSAFVAAGFEHSVANMYFLSLAWLLTVTHHVPPGFDASLITIPGIVHNLVPVTLGNIVGGAGFVGFVYWAIYRKGLGARSAEVRK
jgi:formate transporter